MYPSIISHLNALLLSAAGLVATALLSFSALLFRAALDPTASGYRAVESRSDFLGWLSSCYGFVNTLWRAFYQSFIPALLFRVSLISAAASS